VAAIPERSWLTPRRAWAAAIPRRSRLIKRSGLVYGMLEQMPNVIHIQALEAAR
jgi:hypothetical protein